MTLGSLVVSHIASSRGSFLEQSSKGAAEVLAWKNTERMGCHLPKQGIIISIQRPICGALFSRRRFHGSRNQGIYIGMAPLTTTPNDLSEDFVLSVQLWALQCWRF